MIKYVIFDLDDTLCDYQKAKQNAINSVNNYLTELFWEKYHANESSLFRKFLSGSISKDEYRERRFGDVFDSITFNREEKKLTTLKLNSIYMDNANKKIELFSDVIPVIETLKRINIHMAVLTNGPKDGQNDKFYSLGLERYITKLYISEEIGFSKPNPKAFKFVLNDLSLDPSEALMIGDSIDDDYKGAESVGIKSVLIDRDNKMNEFNGKKIFQLSSLFDFL